MSKFEIGDEIVCMHNYAFIRRGSRVRVAGIAPTGALILDGIRGTYKAENFRLKQKPFLEAGKTYVARNGSIMGPIIESSDGIMKYHHGDFCVYWFSDTGTIYRDREHQHDLVKEYIEDKLDVEDDLFKVTKTLKYGYHGSENQVLIQRSPSGKTDVTVTTIQNIESIREAAKILNKVADFLESEALS